MLPWNHVLQRLTDSLNYWVCTTGPDGRPHATPVWGVVLDGTLYFDGSPETRRGRNLAAIPAVVVHLESGTDVVIVHGEAHEVHGADSDFYVRLAGAYRAKYRVSWLRAHSRHVDHGRAVLRDFAYSLCVDLVPRGRDSLAVRCSRQALTTQSSILVSVQSRGEAARPLPPEGED